MQNTDDEYLKETMDFFADRLAELRIAKNITARAMSLGLGHNKNYINAIESKKAMPSLVGFLEICDYLKITPKDFYDPNFNNPGNVNRLEKMFQKLDPDHARHIQNIMEDLLYSKRKPQALRFTR